jgi:hypothetical protein
MSTANEYRQFAEECACSAYNAETPEITATFLTMAQAWRTAASRIENSTVRTTPTPRDRPYARIIAR